MELTPKGWGYVIERTILFLHLLSGLKGEVTGKDACLSIRVEGANVTVVPG